jgi:hypothetical protein
MISPPVHGNTASVPILITKGDTMTLHSYIGGGYATCEVKIRGNRMTYISHEGGAKRRWMHVIRQINDGEVVPSYITSANDCYAVKIST